MQFSNFLDLTQKLEKEGCICIEENFSWVKDIVLPSIDLGLPVVSKTSKISIFSDKTNPIYIQLSDGSKLFFTYDEFKRIQGKPKVGKVMQINMQRLGQDSSLHPSKITLCKVMD